MPHNNPRSGRLRIGIVASRTLLIGLIAVTASLATAPSHAAPGANWSRMIVAAAQGESLRNPAQLLAEATAGPWLMSVLEVVTGDDATALVTSASSFNETPAEGLTYVAVRVKATNTGNQPYQLDQNDFGIVGTSGFVRRFAGAVPPDPALDGAVGPGETAEGWIVGGATEDDPMLLLLYDSTTLTGNWADAAFALTDGAKLDSVGTRAAKTTKSGRDAGNPVGIGTEVATSDWVVEIVRVVQGANVVGLFPSSDYRTTALLGNNPSESEDSAAWIAIEVKVTNNRAGNEISYLPLSAFTLADGNGDPVPDLSTLTAPSPEAAGYYYPGASREGWVLFDAVDYGGALLRFLPYRTDKDARYLTWDGGAVDTEPSFEGTLKVGTKVVTNEDLVRLRAGATTDSDIVDELSSGTVLTITGEPTDGDGFTWYPVKNEATGETGFVAQHLIEPEQ